jgi:hypothetical protein
VSHNTQSLIISPTFFPSTMRVVILLILTLNSIPFFVWSGLPDHFCLFVCLFSFFSLSPFFFLIH